MGASDKPTAPVPIEGDLDSSPITTAAATQHTFKNLTITRHPGNVFVLTMCKPPENRLNAVFAQTIISALRHIESSIGPDAPGAVIIRGADHKFWCTGLELDESDRNPYANADGFYPLLATLLDYPFPTIALLTGHTFGGGGPFALSCDYRIMNAKRGFFSMPPVNLGLHFDGIGALPRLKLGGRVARKMLLEAHRWTGKEALADGIVDEICEPERMEERAIEVAREQAPRARMGVYGLLRSELWGEALEKFRAISYVHRRRVGTAAKAKI
jgi:enoyl-CoA hydratase/carnithine racemase